MATPGTILSGLGHIGLIGWLIIGWGFDAEPLPIETMDISVISGEEFDQMRARATPDPGDANPEAPVPPVIGDTSPPLPTVEAPAQVPPVPEPVTAPPSELPPPPPPQAPQTVVTDAAPVEPAPPVPSPPTPDVQISDTPTPPKASTVASTISQPPPQDAQIDDIARDAVVPDQSAEAEAVAEEQEATAPEETTTQIVIADLAPATSVRPSTRPSRPVPASQTQPAQAAPTETPAPQEDVLAALEAALAGADAPAIAAGPAMTGAERDSFRVAVNRCWIVDPGALAARVTVEVGFSLERNGSVRGNDVRLLSSEGDSSAVDAAFRAARSAILRCQSGGYQLPADKYDQWQEVVITFDPSGMRLR
jgi:hypothetical protein